MGATDVSLGAKAVVKQLAKHIFDTLLRGIKDAFVYKTRAVFLEPFKGIMIIRIRR